MRIVNLMSRDLIFLKNGRRTRYPRSFGSVPEKMEKRKKVDEINGVPVNRVSSKEVGSLPEPEEDVALVVSSIVASACSFRNDLYIPDEVVVDEKGEIVCKALCRAHLKK